MFGEILYLISFQKMGRPMWTYMLHGKPIGKSEHALASSAGISWFTWTTRGQLALESRSIFGP
jgi:hypothetical protein